ncbi:nucleotide sugar dehydrogenase [Dolosicoccus paucivorans]|uniref:Nucleotide sugar dehydrogenase n=1 Tax=Dolosicoccus paucivorans TaxID=84521 RepID=A0A1G8MTH2_9LACT|nr:nucleotide sugar dehydrogenase [Dolosicoccus paucivorans]PMB84838.1 nucleotide sugar dehydrogenase [Dolosicoccus paucivorans]PMC58834.1 nucleotide sugar dehydrogenase [Dolosicoccus paucivorans]SDI71095.1 UDP-N-acetyl-D-galactosamine dehydrogenase [Dolosicoccus paucivorans]
MTLYQQLLNKQTKLSVVGLGYVGMPIAVAFAKKVDVIGYDYNAQKIDSYLQGTDPTNEVGDQAIKETTMTFTNDPSLLKEALFHIVAVPTPINLDKTPDLTPIISATKTVGKYLQKGSIVVYESTVYPGVTEDVCIPLLEEVSGLKCGEDFAVGYSPERINPGDKVNTLENIVKIISSTDEESLEEMANIYEIVVKAGVHKASDIKVAEAAKVAENSQRDINIAFMNELALVFDRMGIDTQDVIDAMNTKWNALGFTPGLVGGHCIGVDPYYFLYEAENLGYHSQIILSGRQVNDSMGEFVADSMIKQLVLTGKKVIDAKVAIFGLTFKENTPDVRNSKVIDIITRLNEYGVEPLIVDPYTSSEEAMAEYGVKVTPLEEVKDLDGLILAVAHREFLALEDDKLESFYNQTLPNDERVLLDVKSVLDKSYFTNKGYRFWRL